MMLIDGKAHAARLRADIAQAVIARGAAGARAPALAVVLVGDDPASHVYVRNKIAACAEAGITSIEHRRDADLAEAELLALVESLNRDAQVDGILVQLPLPAHIDAQKVIAAISPDKDVDGFHPVNAGRLATGLDGFVPCTPLGCLRLLESTLGDLTGAEALVIGRSNIVGRPMASLLISASATVTVAHSRSRDLPGLCRRADIVVAAVGRPEMLRGSWLKPGSTVIDVGINRVAKESGTGTRLVGDVCFTEAAEVAAHITPVPGGVGPMTIACLLENTLKAASQA
ncbi:bifunctional methylenetetrahydrofolate dehydrogenase/methenyltetrahydrofolate cyclohydrolase FolD [Sandaracinobacter sp. RS1-74]|uniref:bifunctional methylenetetrahydrofolate dehydrogenase/methenyltetrahydrofolate cyclohydrolase FolD n=1 Tax=Sandaracinobacteroides sayramensis TaxID=2913411 RepID=UPI001EDC3FB3|nr:bifunctional methylenetetrahydrofolate dehydrogenase/methenyltetrahydrofolate cyclohydrolase FolD [Sandaracinobacteroides sayramensis]MCG2842724.1 bifunctional methylenetetrahydrofolate dehydrogenase/methenyltetrahydrofolate cyclohydrolase FolD [Sandaracinobacteroides sayramensis]